MEGVEGKLFDFENWFEKEHTVLDFIQLLQISEVVLEPGGQIYDHLQKCHEITYIISGAGIFYTDGVPMRVEHSDIHVISQNRHHQIIAGQYEKLRYICIGFRLEQVPEPFREAADFYASSPNTTVRSEGEIRHLFDMLIQELYSRTAMEDPSVELLLKLILLKVYRCFVKRTERLNQEKELACGNATVYKVIKYIDYYIYPVKSVREIADALNFTENYLSHLFKQHMGIPLSAYIKQKKLETAKILLENRKMSLTEIAEVLNYDSVQSLSRAFKLEFGVTSTRYLQEQK